MNENDRDVKRDQELVLDDSQRMRSRHSTRDVSDWFARLDALNDEPFMLEGRAQPATPPATVNFDD